MSDMKVRIVVEDADGRTRTATLSFEEETTTPKEKPKGPEKAMLVDRLEKAGFTVRDRLPPSLEPWMIGELHLEKQYGHRDRCCDCGKPTWVLMEVVEDDAPLEEDYPFISVDHDLAAEVCIDCGHFHMNPGMTGAGVFGFLDDEEFERFQDFLDTLSSDRPEVMERNLMLQRLIRQERLHMKAVYRIRQQLLEMRAERLEAKIMALSGVVEKKEKE